MKKNRSQIMTAFTIATMATISFNSYSQHSLEITQVLIGKWKVCRDTQFSRSYSCDNPYTTYIIGSDGNYTEGRQVISGGNQFQVTGKWTLKDSILTLQDDAKSGYRSSPHRYKFQIIDKNLLFQKFVNNVENPGQVYYVYFRRSD